MEKRAILIPNSEHSIEMTPNLARVTIHANVQIVPQSVTKSACQKLAATQRTV
ncbi:MAG TPA: hypothetical protein VGM27_08935 [Acidobacteriaceae bacterium]|jgi:predicted class III extradiol MEMO1 family dioxygenase